jgi:hypothetical protein
MFSLQRCTLADGWPIVACRHLLSVNREKMLASKNRKLRYKILDTYKCWPAFALCCYKEMPTMQKSKHLKYNSHKEGFSENFENAILG